MPDYLWLFKALYRHDKPILLLSIHPGSPHSCHLPMPTLALTVSSHPYSHLPPLSALNLSSQSLYLPPCSRVSSSCPNQEEEVVTSALRRCPVKAYKPPKRVCAKTLVHEYMHSNGRFWCLKYSMLASCRRTVKRSVPFAWRSTKLRYL